MGRMKKELLRIENGVYIQNDRPILYAVFLRLFYGEIAGITSDRSYAIDYLLKILSGQQNFASGFIYCSGHMASNAGETASFRSRYALINACSSFIKTLTLSENVFALKEGTPLFFHKKESEFSLRKKLDEFDIRLSVDTPVKKLNLIQRIQIEMIKWRIHGKQLFLIDMRNLYLSAQEKKELYQFLDRFRNRGECAIAVFDNQPHQISELVEKLILLSDGKVLMEIEKSESRFSCVEKNFSTPWDKAGLSYKTSVGDKTKEILRFSNVSTAHMDYLDFSLHAGEIITISSDRFQVIREVEQLFKGEIVPRKGEIYVHQKPYRPRKKHQILKRFSIAVIENPMKDQLLLNLNFYDNLCISRGLQMRGFWYDRSLKNSIRDYVNQYMGEDFTDRKAAELTMAEKQRLLYLRWMLCSPDVVVCVEPFKSVDKYLEEDAVDMILEMARKGIAVIILTHNAEF